MDYIQGCVNSKLGIKHSLMHLRLIVMLTTGNQLKAARALAGMDQSTLAGRAGVNINTIGAMEKRGAEVLKSGLDTIRAVMDALEAEGVEFLNHGQPGVRLQASYRLTPIDLAEPIWEASTVRGPIWLRANTEAEARQLAKRATVIAVAVKPGTVHEGSPWALSKAALCELMPCPFNLKGGEIRNSDGLWVANIPR